MCLSSDGGSLVDCGPGLVCCVDFVLSVGTCAQSCPPSHLTYACDGPEDCPGDTCCAPDEAWGDVTCENACADDETVCNDSGDCDDACAEDFPGPLGDAYTTCF
jgi:hypothetical protein